MQELVTIVQATYRSFFLGKAARDCAFSLNIAEEKYSPQGQEKGKNFIHYTKVT